MNAARGGDENALGELIQRYQPALRQFIRLRSDAAVRRKESVSDLVQTVCREVLENLAKYEYRGENSFRNWLFGCALNSIRSRRRYLAAQKRDVQREQTAARHDESYEQLAEQYATLCSPSRFAMARENVEKFEAAFDQLPSHYQEVILLSRLQRVPHKEIGERMGLAEGAVRQLLSRALLRLSRVVTSGGTPDRH